MSLPVVAHTGPWTVQDVLTLPEDGQRHEVIDGSLILSPAPGIGHQQSSRRLANALESAAPAGFEVGEAVNVQIGPGDLLIPDVVVLRDAGHADKLVDVSQVVLVAEVVSPSSVRYDRFLKPKVYADAGVPVYLRVELEPGDVTVAAYLLDQTRSEYREVAAATAGDVLRLDSPFPIALDPAALLRLRSSSPNA